MSLLQSDRRKNFVLIFKTYSDVELNRPLREHVFAEAKIIYGYIVGLQEWA
jgi:hypothetical protein